MTVQLDPLAEWLEADGLGGFASGTVCGRRTRRYHALLLTATAPPTGRILLVNGFDAGVRTAGGSFALSSQRYSPDIIHPDGARRIERFDWRPWPRWTFLLEDGTRIVQEIFACHGSPMVVLSWRLLTRGRAAELTVRPFLSGRDYHATHHENSAFRFEAEVGGPRVRWRPYEDLPAIVARTNGGYHHEPLWYRNFLDIEERSRGLACLEDLASPGSFTWDLAREDAVWVLSAEPGPAPPSGREEAPVLATRLRAERERRANFATGLDYAADAYVVRRDAGTTIVAGYPWFTDWGRDTFISMRGLCLATGRLDDARSILHEWAMHLSGGMLPNRFCDAREEPEYGSVDAALWFLVAVHDFLDASEKTGGGDRAIDLQALRPSVEAILSGYREGTRFGIGMDEDGLLAAGEAGRALTWMDARVNGRPVTPRIGKPVEVQALWINALKIGATFSRKWTEHAKRATQAFGEKFWNEAGGCLYDVIDVDHEAGKLDASLRPNQILAVGGLPFSLLEGERARRVVDVIEARLWTPLGLRTLAPGEPGYHPRYEGPPAERDAAYHQGTVWPWLMGPFVEAWVRVHGGAPEARREARRRFLAPLLEHLKEAGLGHVSEIADAEPPHTPRGCPFQAWSLGELLRMDRLILETSD